jgi:hypothetical protein
MAYVLGCCTVQSDRKLIIWAIVPMCEDEAECLL